MATTQQSPTSAERRSSVLRHRWRWLAPSLLIVAWLAVLGIAGPSSGKLSQVQENENSSFLPKNAQSAEAMRIHESFTKDQSFPALVLFESDQRLTPQQLAVAKKYLDQTPDRTITVKNSSDVKINDFLLDQGKTQLLPAKDGKAALAVINFDAAQLEKSLADGESPIERSVASLRDEARTVEKDNAGLKVYVAGPAGSVADFVIAFGGIDGTLVSVALIAVLIILLFVYRSPFVPVFVLLSVGCAATLAFAIVYQLAKNDVVTLDGQGQGILSILVIGAATDYALLLVSRYREELRKHDDRYEAMWLAWRRAAEPIGASAATTALALLCLLAADIGPTRSLGPIGAIGIGSAALAVLSFLPVVFLAPGIIVGALAIAAAAGVGAAIGQAGDQPAVGAVVGAVLALAVAVVLAVRVHRARQRRASEHRSVEAGRWAFWPVVPHVGSTVKETKGVWAAVSRGITKRPRLIWLGVVVILLILAAFIPTLRTGSNTNDEVFLTSVESVTGGKQLANHFPGGLDSTDYVLAKAESAQPQPGSGAGLCQKVLSTPGVAAATWRTANPAAPPVPCTTPGVKPVTSQGYVELDITLTGTYGSTEAIETVNRLRDIKLGDTGDRVLVGGSSATEGDILEYSDSDMRTVAPLILLVVFLVLMVLLRALVAPVLIIIANVLSFAATMGVSALVFNHIVDFPNAQSIILLYGFVFLVALGIDYSIFLMTRVREESIKRGTRPGVLAGLTVTGGVITSAGVVLAATFAALAVLPILFMVQIAFIVAFGVLLDTFVIRSLLVPALSYDVGRRIWWPSKLSRRDAHPNDDVPAEHTIASAGLSKDDAQPDDAEVKAAEPIDAETKTAEAKASTDDRSTR